MSDKKVMNRWLVVLGAIMIQFCLGALYAWSVFTPSLKNDYNWSVGQTQGVFAASLAVFAIVMVMAGKMMPKFGPRLLAMVGGVVVGLGYILGGLVDPANFWLMFLFIGVVGGAGIGITYVVPIAVGMRWFPDKKGLITGLAVAGFGFGALLWVKLAADWGNLIANFGLPTTFVIYGIIFLIVVVVGGIWMVFPPEGWAPAGWTGASVATGNKKAVALKDYVAKEMLVTPQFYMIFFAFVAGSGAGLMSIGLMKLFPMQALQANGYDMAEASVIAGTAIAVYFSIFNGLGRIAWGMIADYIGGKWSVFFMMLTQGIIVILFPFMAGTKVLLYLGAGIIGFNFGGNFSLFPTITAGAFGSKNIAQLYPWVFLAYGVGGIFGPMIGGKLGDMGNFPLAFTICGILCIIAAIVVACIRRQKKA